jgi:DNA-binding NtrC family response regulator
MVKEGGFREDLLYRLDVVEIHLPALRERREDIPQIAEHFLARLRETRGIPRFELAPETRRALMAYDWPGNVRELRNVLERAAVLAENPGVLVPADLPDSIAAGAGAEMPLSAASGDFASPWDFGPEGTDFYKEMENFERRMIGRALQLAGGSKREAARLLQVNRTTLLEKLKRRGWELRGGALEPVEAPVSTPDAWQGLRRSQATYQPGHSSLELEKPLAVTGS